VTLSAGQRPKTHI